MKKSRVFLTTGLSFFGFIAAVCYAAVPEPQSEGKYFTARGTKASETYEPTAGMPVYDYGKGIQWGPLHLKPDAEYTYSWTDNVFYDQTDGKSDYVNRFHGEMLAELPLGGGQHLLSGSYSVTRELFERFDGQNHTDQRGTLGLKLNYVPFTLDVEDTYERTVSRADTEFTSRIQRDENAFHSLLEIPFASFFLENEITDFDEQYSRPTDKVFDHNLFTVYQRVGYDMRPTTQLLAEYAFLNIDYSNVDDRNGVGNQFMIGLRGNFTERIAYQAWTGAQYRIYDEDIRPDFNGFVCRTALQWNPSETNQFIIRADRSPQESTFDGQSFYTRNRVELTWRRQIAGRWFWNAHGMAGYHEYSRVTVVPPPIAQHQTRQDTVWDAGTGLEYRMPNDIVSVVLDYRFATRDSNLEGLSYEANEISAGLKARF
jgi:hypothetical protein